MSVVVQGISLNFDADPFDAAALEPTSAGISCFDDIPDILSLKIDPIEYLVDEIIARKSIVLWSDEDGSGKSILAMRMAVAVAYGRTVSRTQ